MNDQASSATGVAAGRLLAGRYQLGERLAMGGMAEVWRATDCVLNRPVAVKMLHRHLANDVSLVERFRAEALAVAKLSHPGIVSVYDTVTDNGVTAIIMELVPGNNLRDELQARGVLPIPQAVRIAAAVADALSVAHAAGVVHRDVKPANILLCPDGRVLIADFGIAKVSATAALTVAGTMLGTAGYLSPEQVEGHPTDARADIYGLGAVLYEMLTGQLPFKGESDAALALARLHTDPSPPSRLRPGIPERLDRIVLISLARRPGDRYHSAAAMCDALLGQRTGQRPVPTGATPLPRSIPSAASAGAPRTGASGSHPRPAPARRPPAPTGPHGQPRLFKPLIIGLVASAILVIILLTIRNPAPAAVGQPRKVDIASVGVFDPAPGDTTEHNDQLRNLIDGDNTTVWTTEGYSSATFGNKAGVGVVLQLSSARKLQSLVVVSASNDWTAAVYIAPQPGAILADWGPPVARVQSVGVGSATFDLKGTAGRSVLLWITRLSGNSSPFSVKIAELTLIA